MKVGGAKWPRKAGRRQMIVVQDRVRLWQTGLREYVHEEGMNEGGSSLEHVWHSSEPGYSGISVHVIGNTIAAAVRFCYCYCFR